MRTITVERIDALTRSRLATVSADALLVDAAKLLSDTHISLVIVCDPDGLMVGVITKTNIVQQVGHSCEIIGAALAGEVMTRVVTSCRPTDSLLDVMAMMEKRGFAHIPVVGANLKPRGVVNAGDALRALIADEKYEARLLRDYVMGIGYQ